MPCYTAQDFCLTLEAPALCATVDMCTVDFSLEALGAPCDASDAPAQLAAGSIFAGQSVVILRYAALCYPYRLGILFGFSANFEDSENYVV